ncbi:MAG TPA: hypothetical protein VIJ33_10755 [Solirubrobacteraceae bacterium]
MRGETKGTIVRPVLLERHLMGTITLYGRALWASTCRAEIKCWASGAGVQGSPLATAKLATRSRTMSPCRDPLLAMEWAFGMWDEYVADVAAAFNPPAPDENFAD